MRTIEDKLQELERKAKNDERMINELLIRLATQEETIRDLRGYIRLLKEIS